MSPNRSKLNTKMWLKKIRSFFIAKIAKNFINLIFKTCRIQVEGVELFRKLIREEKCILVFWHNRLAIIPSILYRYVPHAKFAALISGSQDGDILNYVVKSYKNGRAIRVFHRERSQALREVVKQVNEREHIVIITPDGPRGPCYEIKPGIFFAAKETKANVVCLNWEADRFWQMKTWDRLRLPKPFSTIRVTFTPPMRLDDTHGSLTQFKESVTHLMGF